MKLKKRIFVSLCTAVVVLGSGIMPAFAETDTIALKTIDVSDKYVSYEEYRENNNAFPFGDVKTLTVSDIAKKSENAEISNSVNFSDISGAIIPDDGYASWKFRADKDCSYIIRVKYVSAEASGGNMELQLNIDGKIPYSEVTVVSFERIYEQAQGEFTKNAVGNDIKPAVTEVFMWQETYITDSSGYITEPFVFDFTAGEHTITFKGSRGKIAISEITLEPLEQLKSYEDYLKEIEKYDNFKGENIVIEAEHLKYKNAVTILPDTDRSSAATTPQSDYALLLNTLGGDSWKSIGNSVTWEFEVEESGVYEISTRFLQNTKDGIFTCRKLYIDGEVPFSEAESIRFNYDSGWQTEKLGYGDDVFKFYFSEGKHTITLEVTAGDVSDIIATVSTSINALNRINRRIKLITGNNVDVNRDYNFEALIPDEIKEMGEICKELRESVDYINEQAGDNGSFVAVIQKIIFQLEVMSETPRLIPKYFERFQTNLGAMGEWLLSATEQPLKLDKLYIQPVGNDTPKADAGFFKSLWFGTKSFLFSFATDYSTVGGENGADSDKTLTVWVQTGRDQAQIVRELADESFAEQSGATIKIQVVSSGLLQSVLAGNSPDVVTDCAETLPLEYALRNATTDLTRFDDFEEIFSRFTEASVKPAKFRDAVYGMPQTFSFLMMFYRTDIFEEYGYTVPSTWNELCEMIPALQRNGMEVGMPHGLDMYTTILYQNGGNLYKGDGYATTLSDYTSVTAFANMTEFFTLYDCPVTYDFANRFRSGEIPIGIAAYTEYNQLTAFAPEIKGMWKMVPIPGTIGEDGTINNVSVGTSTFIVIMNSSKNKELAWEFLKWFMSTEVQGNYAVQMESILGTCAKVASANVEALANMTWSSSEYKELFKQMENADSVPQVPGSYYLSRIVTFAFNRVYNNDENPKEVIGDYIKELNDELTHKRAEFGLED